MRHLAPLLLALVLSRDARAAAAPLNKGTAMHYGPVLSCTVEAPLSEPERSADRAKRPTGPAPPPADALQRILARKGIVIELRDGADAGYVCFDSDTLRIAAGWTNGFLDLSETNIGTYKGNRTGAAVIDGTILFQVANGPGWSVDGKFDDPRPGNVGPMPHDQFEFKGFYLHGGEVVLSYRAGGVQILEKPGMMRAGPDGQRFITRTICLEADRPASVSCLVVTNRNSTLVSSDSQLVILKDNPADDSSRLAVFLSNPAHARWVLQQGRVALNFSDLQGSRSVHVGYWHGSAAELPRLREAVHAFPKIDDLPSQIAGGAPQWPALTSTGSVATENGAYVIDTIPIPEENPWNSWMRISAFDFFADGRAAVATLNGDVWLVSGLDAKLERVSWKRFAVGFYEPLGLKIIDEKIYVHGRDQITRLHDLNGDDEADFYECFNNERTIYPSYHAYAYDLQTDRAGNLYYVVGGAWLGKERPWHACLIKVSPDGRRSDVVATGFRAPNGMAIGPDDAITVSDNQGNWIPASKISRVRSGGFYGFVADPRVEPDAKGPEAFDQPICWIPQSFDNSSGGQVWAPVTWGPFGGKLLHTSYGAAALFAVLTEQVDGVDQGGVLKFPLKFDSGIMRARFAPHDGQLYVAGLRGWQTAGTKDGCLQRVRFTGHPAYMPRDLHITKEGLAITFAQPLQRESAADAQNYAIEQWNYRWSSTYGSPDYSLLRPGSQGRDNVEIAAAELSPDAKTVRLSVPGIKPVMQMLIKFNVTAADGTPIRAEIANTIHRVPVQ